jgi:hypothetical protein
MFGLCLAVHPLDPGGREPVLRPVIGTVPPFGLGYQYDHPAPFERGKLGSRSDPKRTGHLKISEGLPEPVVDLLGEFQIVIRHGEVSGVPVQDNHNNNVAAIGIKCIGSIMNETSPRNQNYYH